MAKKLSCRVLLLGVAVIWASLYLSTQPDGAECVGIMIWGGFFGRVLLGHFVFGMFFSRSHYAVPGISYFLQ